MGGSLVRDDDVTGAHTQLLSCPRSLVYESRPSYTMVREESPIDVHSIYGSEMGKGKEQALLILLKWVVGRWRCES